MAETLRLIKTLRYAEDLGGSASIVPVAVLRKGPLGTTLSYDLTPVNSASLFCSSTIATTLGLAANAKLDAALTASIVALATTSVAGKVKISDAQADPIAVTTNNAAYLRILSVAVTAGINAAVFPVTGTNPVQTQNGTNTLLHMFLGSGKDGYGQVGALAATGTAPTFVVSTDVGTLTGTFTYKVSAYNLSGSTVASAASASTGAITAKFVTLTLPSLPAGAMGWQLYRSSDGITWKFVTRLVNGTWNFNTTDNTYVDNIATPHTSLTAPASDTTGANATMSGRYEFITCNLGTTTATIAATGNTAGLLDIRVQGLLTGTGAWTITGAGSNAVNVGHLRRFAAPNASSVGCPGSFTGLTSQAVLWTTAQVAGAFATTTIPAQGLGADRSMIGTNYSGFGTKGNTGGGTGGDGGYGGPMVRIWAYQFASNTLAGTIIASGGVGTASSGSCAGGGGGGGGGIIDIGALIPWKDTGTRTAAGGAGGATVNTGGASTVYGGPGGGGGAIIRRNCNDKASATDSVAGGAAGANTATATATQAGPQFGGSHYGLGGITVVGSVSAATAGQVFDFNSLNDPTAVFAS